MADNLDRHVKWQDEGGGWHTGREVIHPDKQRVTSSTIFDPYPRPRLWFILVRESCNGCLTWVDEDLLQDWPMRSEWEGKVLEEPKYLKDGVIESLTIKQLRSRYGMPKEQKTQVGDVVEEINDHGLCANHGE